MTNKYYQKHKEKLRKEARERYQHLSEEERQKAKKGLRQILKCLWRAKSKKHQYYREHITNLSEEEKEKKVEYMKNYHITHKK